MSLFPGLIGHEKAKEVISRMLEHKTLPHALLFIGPVQVGKTMFIELLIKSLFETTKSLELIPDVLTLEREVDPKTEKTKSNLSVEQVREFVQRLSMSAMLGSWKVGFIKEADRLSMAAANALLKTLEEPKGKTFIVLRATSTRDVPATIVSRCQVIRLYSVSEITIQEALVKRGLAKSDATAFTKRSYGRPGIAIDAVTSSQQQAEADVQTETFLKLLQSSLPEQFAAVTELVSKDEQNKTDELIDGLQSPLGLEALATLDWMFSKDKCEPNLTQVKEGLRNWHGGNGAGERKLRIFSDTLLTICIDRLSKESFLYR